MCERLDHAYSLDPTIKSETKYKYNIYILHMIYRGVSEGRQGGQLPPSPLLRQDKRCRLCYLPPTSMKPLTPLIQNIDPANLTHIKKFYEITHLKMPCRIESTHGKILKTSHEGNGMCKKNPILQSKFSSPAICLIMLAANIK